MKSILVVPILGLFAAMAHSATINNGSFDANSCAGVCSITPSGWTLVSGNVEVIGNNFWQSAHGANSIDLDGTSPGTIQQSIATEVGTMYRVSFYLAGNSAGAPAIKTVRVSAAGSQQDYTFDTAGKTTTNMGWVLNTFDFTATAASSLLRFQSLTGGSAFGPALDGISIEELAAPVPEPTSIVLLSTGALCLLLRRKR